MSGNTLGQQLSVVLREHGIVEPIHSLHGGPDRLAVITYALDAEGRKHVGDDGRVAINLHELDLRS